MKLLFEARLGFKKYEIYYCQFGRDEMKVSPHTICTLQYVALSSGELIRLSVSCEKAHVHLYQ